MTDTQIKTEVARINKALRQTKADFDTAQEKLFSEWDALTKACPHNDIYVSPVCGTRVCRVCHHEGV